MATATSPAPDERNAKRPKPAEDGSASQQPHEEGGPPSYNGRPPPMYHYPPNGGHPPPHPSAMPPYPGMGGMPPYGGQYGGHWGAAPGAPGHMYPGSRPPHGPPPPHMPPGGGPPDRPGWNPHYRSPPPHHHLPTGGRSTANDTDNDDKYMKNSVPTQAPPYGPGGWGHAHSWHNQGPYGPPPGYGGHAPPMPHQSPTMYSQPYGGQKSPPRPRGDMYGRPPPPQPAGRPEMDISYLSTSGGMARPMMDDDGANSSEGGSARDKGRGSYKCGRCGVPKKGHVCPYQPKLKRRPDQPPPEIRHAAVQVEMDEFMTLRRLNIRIQGFPESYATEPYMMEQDMVGSEPRHVTNESLAAPPLAPDINNGLTAIPHDSKVDVSMEESDRREEMLSQNGSRPSSSTSRDMAFGDGVLLGGGSVEDVTEIADV